MKSDDTAYNILHKRQETDFFSLLNKTSLLEVKYWTLLCSMFIKEMDRKTYLRGLVGSGFFLKDFFNLH